MKKHRSLQGDVFGVRLADGSMRCFQYIARDMTQLNSNVIRVFHEVYQPDEPVDVQRVTSGRIDFHVHVFLNVGVKLGFWHWVGRAKPPERVDVLFRDSEDYGDPSVKVSTQWYVWQVNAPMRKIGALVPKYQESEIGIVVPPHEVVHRIQHGRYEFSYPRYEPYIN